MPAPKELDPTRSLSALFGAKLRKLRVNAGLTQKKLGQKIPIAHSMIARFELGTETPTQQVVEKLDRLLGADGELVDLWMHVVRTPIPDWARKYVRLEADSHKIQKYVSHTVPGMLQTPAYVRELLTVAVPTVGDQLEDMLTARLARQKLLYREDAPVLWVVLDEAVLRRSIGGPAVMREQLGHLLSVSEALAKVTLQVLPYDRGAHPVLGGSLTVLSFLDRPGVAYLENSHSGELVEHAGRVSEYDLAFDHLLAQALSPEASARLIRTVMEESYRDPRLPSRAQRRRLAQVQLQQHTRRGLRRGR
ncbi:helix-turn-helix transcriptional regulator [Streptomyces sp. TRM49041]|uniref:helix-turn-helix domain-containing protein n=1 Tax=Streptomyces sp. TRM49041 TaxID=2603216 RepID=UPI0011EC6C9B|nr:helix-turn-helix transcriptional regulator [Streptomyces sp. TRM49041]